MTRGRLRWATIPAFVGLLAMGALLWFTAVGLAKPSATASATLVDATKNTASVAGSPQEAAPGSFVAIKVTGTPASGETWRSTSYAFGGGTETCKNTADHTGTATEFVDATLPETTPASGSVTVRLYAADNCPSVTPLASAEANFRIRATTTNKDLIPHCDSRVALVLDESGSIGSTTGAKQAVINGSKAFVNGLVDSGAQLAVLEFSSSASTVTLGGNVYNNVTSQFASGPFATYISSGYAPGGYTNWEDALAEVGTLNPKPELVVFLTDGDPTARNTGSGAETGFDNGSYLAMNPAFTEANKLKESGLHMFAIGVGAALTNENSLVRLRAISGPNAFPEHPLLGADYTAISDFSQLEEALATIGRALCSVRVKVTKLVDDEADGSYAPANGWKFDGTVTVSATPDSYRWLVPGTETGPPSGGNTRTATTANDFTGVPGSAAFVWKPSPTTQTSKVVLTDVGKSGYHFVSVSCSKNGNPITVPNAATVTVDSLVTTDYVDCEFKNQRNVGKLKVEKRFIGSPVEVSLLIDGSRKKTSAETSFDTGFVTVDIGTHGVSEEFTSAAQAALYESSYACTNAAGVVLKQGDGVLVTGGIDVSNGASIVCRFTNTKKSLSVGVAKDADPGSINEPGGEVRFSVGVVNRTAAAVKVTALHDDVFGNLDKDSPAGSHTWIESSCAAGVPLAAFDGKVGGEDTYTCSFVGRVTGEAGTTHRNTVKATITDESGESKSEEATAKVEIVDVRPSIAVTKTATPSLVQNSGQVTFTVVVTNTSPVDALMVDQLIDSIHGDLIHGPVKASCTYGGSPITLPHGLPVGESFVCTFRATVSVSETDTVTASGTDSEGNRVTDAAEALVTVEVTPAPIPPEQPKPPEPNPEPIPPIQLSLSKTAPATVFLNAEGRASFVYEIRASSVGPAPNTTLTDVAPRGVTFTRIIDQPAPGVCSISRAGKLLTCSGSLVGGQSYGIKILVSVTAGAGTTITNTAVATCKPVSGAPCAAQDSARTRLIGLFLPPSGCASISVSPGSLLVNGQSQMLVVKVRNDGRPVAGATVVVAGPAVRASANTGSTGVARITVTPTLPGVLTVSLRGEKACSVQRVGVVAGSVLPSLTG